MHRTLVTGILMALAAIAGYLVATLQQPIPHPRGSQSAIIAPTRSGGVASPPAPTISAIEALDHRATHYRKLASVDDILELPTDFLECSIRLCNI